ncbi:MAG TPA: DEAD/DEAH box helicase family protein, partial [Oligoflexia bacterium]|nr:DEAD/DEAH box helicase family protein [Oligoflexia bacterium]
YRLLKAKRFRRALFLVDRNTLGEQALATLKDVKLENYQAFTDIYDVKELGDLRPEKDTRLHVATVQSIMQRVLYPSEDDGPLAIDTYDLIVIDECHRGYTLDRDLSDNQLLFGSEEDYVSKYRRALEHFDAVKIGLTATPALHTVEIFGKPVFTYTYQEAVVDGWLRDYEPPIKITTKLGRDGITWEAGSEITVYKPRAQQLELITTPDEVHVEIEEFNKQVLTENFNLAVCRELVKHIDPHLPGKTLIFCVNDKHADTVVKTLIQAFEERYGEIEDDAVQKITGATDKPLQAFRRFQNERLPSVAVTVDYLTTGIDVEEIVNLVFIRRVRSRILFEQMIGRATRNREDLYGKGEHKESFRIFDAVDVYSALEDYNSMKPIVVEPNITFEKLIQELSKASNEDYKKEVFEQLIAKLRKKLARISPSHGEALEKLSGFSRSAFAGKLKDMGPHEAALFFGDKPALVELLDERISRETAVLVSEHEDEVVSVEQDWDGHKRPEDYLEGFAKYIEENLN